MADVSPRAAARAALLAAGLSLLAGLAMLVLLRPGLPVLESTVETRWLYIREHPAAWWIGWLCWHAAAVALLGFYVGLAGVWRRRAPIRCGLALLCSGAALAADLSGQALHIGMPARLDVTTYALVETATLILTGYVANGLYTGASVLLTWAGAAELPRYLVVSAAPVWIAGAWLSITSLTGSEIGQFWSAALLMPSVVLWATLTGRWLSSRAS
jgi:hypothetical protein